MTRAAVADLVVTECTVAGVPCDLPRAHEFIEVIHVALAHMRATGGSYRVTQRQLDRVHPIMDCVMADDTAARDGSAHAGLQRLALAGDEVAITHSRRREFHPTFCSVELSRLALR